MYVVEIRNHKDEIAIPLFCFVSMHMIVLPNVCICFQSLLRRINYVFVFAYAKRWLSHDAAHFVIDHRLTFGCILKLLQVKIVSS